VTLERTLQRRRVLVTAVPQTTEALWVPTVDVNGFSPDVGVI